VRTGWTESESSLGRFDLIVGSDLLYEPNHAEQLAGFIARHADETCELIVVDPGRGNVSSFSFELNSLGFEQVDCEPAGAPQLYEGRFLRYLR